MSQTKYRLPEDIRRTAIEMVRGYDRRLSVYLEAQYNIINGSSCNFVTYQVKSKKKDGSIRIEQRRQYFTGTPTIGDSTYDKAIRLESLEQHVETRRMRAVEHAKHNIGLDIANDKERMKLIDSIWDSCIEGRNFSFEYQGLCVGRDNFYERRRKFLFEIAESTDFI